MYKRMAVKAGILLSAVSMATMAAGAGGVPSGASWGQAAASAPANVIILGSVVDADTGTPVSGATVTFAMRVAPAARAGGAGTPPAGLPPGANQIRLLTTSEGKFVVRDVPPGNVQLTATAPGYISGGYGKTTPTGSTVPFVVTAGAKVADVTLRMWKTAALTGMVTDDRGEPMARVQVRAFRRTFNRGQPRLATAGLATTDDRGTYRLASLTPGAYVVGVPQTQMSMPSGMLDRLVEGVMSGNMMNVAQSMELAASGAAMAPLGLRMGDLVVGTASGQVPLAGEDGGLRVYPSRFYPGSDSPGSAEVVELRSGEERTGLDLALPLVPTVSVSGVVMGPDGPVGNVGVRFRRSGDAVAADDSFDVAAATTRPDGSFHMPALPVGSYVARVLRAPPPRMSAAQIAALPEDMRAMAASMLGGSGPAPATLFAEVPVAADRDVAGVTLTLGTGATVSGRVEFRGAAAPPASVEAISVTLQPIDAQPTTLRISPTQVSADGTFTTSGYPPGRYTLTAAGRATPGWVLGSVLVGGRDGVYQAFDLGTRDVTDVVVTFVDRPSSLNGTVTPARAGEPAMAAVVAFPAAWREWIAGGMAPQVARVVRSSPKGDFAMPNLPPREYLVVAVSSDAAPDLTDPTVFEALARSATTVTVGEGDTRTVSLRLMEVR